MAPVRHGASISRKADIRQAFWKHTGRFSALVVSELAARSIGFERCIHPVRLDRRERQLLHEVLVVLQCDHIRALHIAIHTGPSLLVEANGIFIRTGSILSTLGRPHACRSL